MTQGASDEFLRHIVSGSFRTNTPSRVGVAVSGGSDSMALLDLFRVWTDDKNIDLCAVTVDHGLRVEAKQEAAFVAAYCADRGVSHDVLIWEGWDGSGNLQAEARNARYQLLADWARERDVDAVAVGHTSNDQAETFLMRLARSSGIDGLAAMDKAFTRCGIRFVRPLLGQSRADLRAYLQRHEISWVDDPSNSDRRFERVKAREALTYLEPLGITERTLNATTHHMSMAASALHHYTLQEANRYVTEDRGDLILTRGPDVPVDIQRRLTLAALRYIGGENYPPRSSALTEMDLGLNAVGKHTLAGCVIAVEADARRFSRELNAVSTVETDTENLWDKRWTITGPHEAGVSVRALGADGLRACPNWRETGMPRASLLSSPAIWRGAQLVAAPLAGLANGWQVHAANFSDFLRAKSL